jgi:hypothetical protein
MRMSGGAEGGINMRIPTAQHPSKELIKYKEVLNFLDRFEAAGASLAESRALVLPMNQSSDGLQSSERSS